MAGSVGDPIAVLYVGGDRSDEQTQRAIDALESDATVNTVTAVSTTADAVSRALKPVDCVVIEYDARGIDGPTVLEETDDRPTIAIFDDGDGSRETGALTSGADRTLRRPADSTQWPAVLVDRVEDAVEQRRLVDGSDDAERRYRSLFENNPHIIWEEDYSASKRRLDDIVARVDDLEAYFDANPEVVRELMADVEIIDVNRNAVDYYDAPSKAALLDNLDKVFTETAYEAVKGMWLAIANGETTYRWETVGQTLSGERKHEIIELNVPDAYADDLSRVYVTAMDITDRKHRQRELQRRRDRLDEFASVVSHDLRNPLSVAEGHLELASDEYDSDHLRKVGSAHDRMRTLIDDLLTLARDGQRVGDPEPIAIREIAESGWETVATADATLTVETQRTVDADRGQLTRLFENFLRNAVEHAGDTVTVRIGDIDADGTDGFYIADDGPGIPPEEREPVTEAGYTTAPDGNGFGLAIVRQVVDAHGWDLTITGSDRGGARFEVVTAPSAPGVSEAT
jgi:signal transduction histidine kinase